MLSSGYWEDLTTTDFVDVDPQRTIALLPAAAIEQHGPHLPLATDAIINAGIVERTLQRLGHSPTVLVLPPMTVGDSLEHTDFPGTLSVASETLLAHWLQVGRCVARAGLRKLVIFNSHGGQTGLVDQLALRLRVECSMLVVRANSFRMGMPVGLFVASEVELGLHGGEIETSMMLHLRPGLVRQASLANFRGFNAELAERGGVLGAERPAGFAWMSQDLHPAGACGNAAGADAGRGAALVDYLSERLLDLLRETAELPLSVLASGDR